MSTSLRVQKMPITPSDDRAVEEDLPECLVEERADVARVDGVDEEADGDGEDRDDRGADAPLGGERVGLAAGSGPGPIMVSATMSRSSARLPPTSRWMPMAVTTHSKSSLRTRWATSFRASTQRTPQPGLGHDVAHVLADGVRQLLGDGGEPLEDREPRAQRGAEQLQHVGELGGERGRAPLGQRHEDHPGDARPPTARATRPQMALPSSSPRAPPTTTADQVDEERLGRPHGKVGLVEEALQVLQHASTRGHVGHARPRRAGGTGSPRARPCPCPRRRRCVVRAPAPPSTAPAPRAGAWAARAATRLMSPTPAGRRRGGRGWR